MFGSFGTVHNKLRLATGVLVQNIFEHGMKKQLCSRCRVQPDTVTFDVVWDNAASQTLQSDKSDQVRLFKLLHASVVITASSSGM